jgi:hypothetical protein
MFYTWFWGQPEIVDFGHLAASATRKTLPNGGVRRAPPFGRVFPAAGAAGTPKIGDILIFRSRDILRRTTLPLGLELDPAEGGAWVSNL